MEAPFHLALARKPTQQRTKHQKIPGDDGELREGEAGEQRCGGTRDKQTPQELTGTWEQAEGRKGGSTQSQDTAADVGTRSELQRRAAEAGGWRVWATFRWTALCARRRGGDRVQARGTLATEATYGW